MKRILKWCSVFAAGVVLLCLSIWVARRSTPLSAFPTTFEVIAHRGVHQTTTLSEVDNDTCTAKGIRPVTHRFIENTIPSIAEAFKDGATIVEVDVHPTTDNHLVVFHDWTLDCRTNGSGVTHEHSLADLKALDIGYGYTADGRSFPLRGATGMMPALEEVLSAFPDRKLLINQKDQYLRTVDLLAAMLEKLPHQERQNLFYLAAARTYAAMQQKLPQTSRLFAGADELRRCGKSLLLRFGFGALPDVCRGGGIALPVRYLWLVPGWPNDFLSKTAAAHVPVYVLDVDTVEQARDLMRLPIQGIVTNRIEVIGPIVAETRRSHQ